MEYAYGHLLEVGPAGQAAQYRFQNYAINQNVNGYLFLPFSFGGAVANLQGDNLDATLQLANTPMTRSWVTTALDNLWVGKVTTILWTPSTGAVQQTLYQYWGGCSSGGWDETVVQLRLDSVLDSVQANIPGRRLHRWLVGNIPFTAQIRV
ncbi:hypothetical protein EBT31_01750 [bacterium]|nr:hypothetical protein [bacterium]